MVVLKRHMDKPITSVYKMFALIACLLAQEMKVFHSSYSVILDEETFKNKNSFDTCESHSSEIRAKNSQLMYIVVIVTRG